MGTDIFFWAGAQEGLGRELHQGAFLLKTGTGIKSYSKATEGIL
jgi:hypothetical protein